MRKIVLAFVALLSVVTLYAAPQKVGAQDRTCYVLASGSDNVGADYFEKMLYKLDTGFFPFETLFTFRVSSTNPDVIVGIELRSTVRNPQLQYYVDGLGSAQQQFSNPITEGNQILVRSGGTPMNGTSVVTYFVEACVAGNVTISGEIDADFDGIPSNRDNCPQVANASQINSFGDERGDGCDPNFYDNGNGVKGFVTNNVINLFGACRGQRCSPVGTIRPSNLVPNGGETFRTSGSGWNSVVFHLGAESDKQIYQVNVYDAGGTLQDDHLLVVVNADGTFSIRRR